MSLSKLEQFAAHLREFICSSARGSAATLDGRTCPGAEDTFNQRALQLFTLQFELNQAYRSLCEARGASPQSVTCWTEIPAVPTSAFKEFELSCIPAFERIAVFHSSGTTGQYPSRHFHHRDSLDLYEASLLCWFERNVLQPPAACWNIVCLTPDTKAAPYSSLAHMLETIVQKFAPGNPAFMGTIDADGAWALDFDVACDCLRRLEQAREPVLVLGTAFGFVHLLDHLSAGDCRFKLPAGSRVMETGGYKGRSRSLPKPDLHRLISERFGISHRSIVCEYGMSELSSQAYDTGSPGFVRSLRFPPWARAQIISPETGREAAEGETGLLRVVDLANAYSVLAIQTEDLAIHRGSGFEILGRAAQSEPRGCSLMSL